jgi:hypothetical protein
MRGLFDVILERDTLITAYRNGRKIYSRVFHVAWSLFPQLPDHPDATLLVGGLVANWAYQHEIDFENPTFHEDPQKLGTYGPQSFIDMVEAGEESMELGILQRTPDGGKIVIEEEDDREGNIIEFPKPN